MAERRDLSGVEVVRVTDDLWQVYRDVRLAALIDSPRAFWSTYAEVATRTDEQWREFVAAGPTTWFALEDRRPVGTVGLWHADEQAQDEVFLIGMWVPTVARGTGVAELLVATALEHARQAGYRRVVLDVADENARAAALYERLGFRATGATGTMPWDPAVTERELALDLGAP